MTLSGAPPEQATDFTNKGQVVSVHRSSPERVVFTEADNTDGWIATDLSVEVQR